MQHCLQILNDFTDKVIKEREANFVDFEVEEEDNKYDEDIGKKKRHVMLDLLLREKKRGNIDNEGIREEVQTFMFAVRKTTFSQAQYFQLKPHFSRVMILQQQASHSPCCLLQITRRSRKKYIKKLWK